MRTDMHIDITREEAESFFGSTIREMVEEKVKEYIKTDFEDYLKSTMSKVIEKHIEIYVGSRGGVSVEEFNELYDNAKTNIFGSGVPKELEDKIINETAKSLIAYYTRTYKTKLNTVNDRLAWTIYEIAIKEAAESRKKGLE